MKYEEAVDFINSAAVFGMKQGLENIGKLLNLLDNPQDKMKIIHVAGTNGKGSVCAYITNILMAAGYRTGLFTSPYVEKFTERIQVDLNNIPDDKLTEYVEILHKKIKIMTDEGYNHPTFFELNTAICFMYFSDMKCDVVVLETGLGGRLDSTNIIKDPVLSVITTIGYDHTAILGDTLAEIAYEKAGIIKRKRPIALYGENENEVVSVIKKRADELKSKMYISNFSHIQNIEILESGYVFDYGSYKGIEIKMLGEHQIKNACLAIDAAKIIRKNGLAIKKNEIYSGLLTTVWPGRIEILQSEPLIICDATHNPQGAQVLKKTIDERFSERKIIYVMGVMKDKNYDKMAKTVINGAFAVITVTPDWHRALDGHILLDTVKKYCENSFAGDTIEEALDLAVDLAGKDGVICTFGSLYYIADVKKYVRENFSG